MKIISEFDQDTSLDVSDRLDLDGDADLQVTGGEGETASLYLRKPALRLLRDHLNGLLGEASSIATTPALAVEAPAPAYAEGDRVVILDNGNDNGLEHYLVVGTDAVVVGTDDDWFGTPVVRVEGMSSGGGGYAENETIEQTVPIASLAPAPAPAAEAEVLEGEVVGFEVPTQALPAVADLPLGYAIEVVDFLRSGLGD